MACDQVIDYYDGSADAGVWLTSAASNTGQAFAMGGTAREICKARFYFEIVDYGGTYIDLVAKVFACDGTPGTDGEQTGSVLATSDTIVYTEAADNAWVDFIFSTPYELSASTNYCVVIECTDIDGAMYFIVPADSTSSAHDGNLCLYSSGTPSYIAANDCNFYIYYALDVELSDTGLLDGKIKIINVSVISADGKVIVKDVSTGITDGKVRVKDSITELLDGKVIIKDTVIGLLDGLLKVKDVTIGLCDGKVNVLDITTDAYDGLLRVKDTITGIVDGKVIIKDTITNILDGKLRIKDISTGIVDGLVNIKDSIINKIDGKVVINYTSIGLFDGLLNLFKKHHLTTSSEQQHVLYKSTEQQHGLTIFSEQQHILTTSYEQQHNLTVSDGQQHILTIRDEE